MKSIYNPRISTKRLIISIGLLSASAVHADNFSALDEAYTSIPNSVAVSQIDNYAPVFDFDNDSCYPSAAISRGGEQNGGLKDSGSITGMCQDSGFLDLSNTYHRWIDQSSNGDEYSAHLYELYFLKDQAFSIIAAGHRHDVETVIVYFKNNQPTHVAVSAHGNYTRKSWDDVPKDGDHPKVVYHRDTFGGLTHSFRFACDPSTPDNFCDEPEVAENPNNTWVTPPIVSWYEMIGDGVPNADMRDRFNTFSYGSASFKFKNGSFHNAINRSDTLPDGFPQFSEENINLSGGISDSSPYSYFANQTGTALEETYEDFVFSTLPNDDIMVIKKANTGSGKTEVHILTASSNYQSYSHHTATPLTETFVNFEFNALPNGDLMAIKKYSTGSGKTEVHILTASSNYQSYSHHTVTALDETFENFVFKTLPNKDLMAIKKSNTGSGKTEVHILTASSNYQSFSHHTVTPLDETFDNYDFSILANKDLMVIKKSATGTETTEVHILKASSNYQTFSLHTSTALLETFDNYSFHALTDGDLMAIKKSNTGTGTTEVHRLEAAAN